MERMGPLAKERALEVLKAEVGLRTFGSVLSAD